MGLLSAGQDLPPDAYRVASGVAIQVGNRSRRGTHPSFDTDDLRQEALILTLTYLRQVEPDWETFPEHGYSRTRLARFLSWRLMDWMRATNPLSANGGSRSVLMEDMAGLEIAEPGDPFQEVEDAATVQAIIGGYSGPPWHIEVALLVAHGYPLSVIGERYGISESRACHVFSTFTSRAWSEAEDYRAA